MSEPSSSVVETGGRASPETGQLTAAAQAQVRWRGLASPSGRYALLRRLLAFADMLAALLAGVSLVVVGAGNVAQLVWSLAYLPVWILVAKLLGLYDRDERSLRHLTTDEVPSLVLWSLIGTSGLTLFLELTPPGRPPSSGGVVAGVTAAVLGLTLRAAARRLWRRTTPPERVAVFGPSQQVDAFTRKLELFPDLHMTVIAVRDLENDTDPARVAALLEHVDRLVVAPLSLDGDRADILALLRVARAEAIHFTLVPPPHWMLGSAVQLSRLAELPLLEYHTGHISRSTLFLKRSLDVTVSAAALVVLLPLFAVIAAAIALESRGPVVFSQMRAGVHGRPFRMHKFRSMVWNAEELLDGLVSFDALEEPMFKLHDDPRVTRVGRTLRRWSLDELPQLWDVLVGDMSLVGPRPEQLELVERYSPEQRFRLEVKPGMTGPMQVYGRGNLSLSERIAVEYDYIENLSIGRDLRIIGMTLSVVLGRRGAF